MANTESRKLMVDVVARVDKLEKAMKRGAQVSDQQMGKVEKRAKTMVFNLNSEFAGIGKTFASAFAGGVFAAGISGAVSGIQAIIKETANLRAEAAKAGTSLYAFQAWKAVAEDTRIPIDAITDALKELSIRADEFVATGKGSAAEAFARLGMDQADIQQRLKDPSALLLEIINRTKALNNQAAATRIFDEMFGGTGAEQAVRLLDEADGSIQKIMDSANETGRILDENMVKRAEEIDRDFNTMWRNFETAGKSAILNISAALRDGLGREMGNIAQYAKDLWNNPSGENLGRFLFGDANDMRVAQAHGPATASNPALEDAVRRKYGPQSNATEITITSPKPPKKPKSGSGTKSRKTEVDEALKQAEAVKALIAELEFEQSLIGKSEVQQAQMTALRQAGSAATAEQKEQIKSLIEATYAQNEALEKAQDKMAELNDAGRDFAGTLVSGLLSGAKATDVLADAVGRLADRFLNSGLDALFGMGGGSGGLIGSLFGGGADPWSGLRLASGGHVIGPGGPRSDSIPAMLSNGEYVVNAAATKKFGPLLDRINSGKGLALAAGGPVLNAPRIPNLASMTTHNNTSTTNHAPTINVNVSGANGNAEIQAMVQQGVAQGIKTWQTSSYFAGAVASGVKQARTRGMMR